jgi:hypothetical protein
MNLVARQIYGNKKGNALDADATAFLAIAEIPNDGTVFYSGTAQEITGAQMHTALQNLVVGFKFYGLWAKLKAFYAFLGGTAFSHKWNLKDPRDLDVAFRLTYVNNPSHSAMGFQGNGTNSYANTFFNLSTAYSNKAMATGLYVNTASSFNGDRHHLGVHTGSANFFSFQDEVNYNFLQSNSNVSNGLSYPGFICGSSTTSTHKLFVNSTISPALATNGNLPTTNIWIGALNLGNSFYGGVNSKIGAVWFATELSDTEVGNLKTLVVNFQTALHRNI